MKKPFSKVYLLPSFFSWSVKGFLYSLIFSQISVVVGSTFYFLLLLLRSMKKVLLIYGDCRSLFCGPWALIGEKFVVEIICEQKVYNNDRICVVGILLHIQLLYQLHKNHTNDLSIKRSLFDTNRLTPRKKVDTFVFNKSW